MFVSDIKNKIEVIGAGFNITFNKREGILESIKYDNREISKNGLNLTFLLVPKKYMNYEFTDYYDKNIYNVMKLDHSEFTYMCAKDFVKVSMTTNISYGEKCKTYNITETYTILKTGTITLTVKGIKYDDIKFMEEMVPITRVEVSIDEKLENILIKNTSDRYKFFTAKVNEDINTEMLNDNKALENDKELSISKDDLSVRNSFEYMALDNMECKVFVMDNNIIELKCHDYTRDIGKEEKEENKEEDPRIPKVIDLSAKKNDIDFEFSMLYRRNINTEKLRKYIEHMALNSKELS